MGCIGDGMVVGLGSFTISCYFFGLKWHVCTEALPWVLTILCFYFSVLEEENTPNTLIPTQTLLMQRIHWGTPPEPDNWLLKKSGLARVNTLFC